MKYDTATPYVASYILIRKGNKIAFVLRENTSWMNGYYGLPSGKVEKNENFTAGAVREAKEEAGITIKPEDLIYVHTCYRNGQDGTAWVDVYFEATNYEGEAYNAEPHMHAELTWLDVDNLPDNMIPSTTFVLDKMKDKETFSEYSWSS